MNPQSVVRMLLWTWRTIVLEICTSAQNYLAADGARWALVTSWEVWSRFSFLTEVTPGLKTADCCSACGERKSRLSSLNILRRESRTCESVWLLMVLMVAGGRACFLLEWDHHVWRLTSCHGCRASWQKVLGSHPWSSTKEPAAPPAPNSKIIRLSAFRLHKKISFSFKYDPFLPVISTTSFLEGFWKSRIVGLWNNMLPFDVVHFSFVFQLHSVSGSEGLFQTNTNFLLWFANEQYSLLPHCEFEGPLTFLFQQTV